MSLTSIIEITIGIMIGDGLVALIKHWFKQKFDIKVQLKRSNKKKKIDKKIKV